jgi:glyoxylase-like metal-dependent hydrolase (beta-lactamase superfamily II)
MIVDVYVTGPLETNTYLIADEKAAEAIVVDPGGEAGPIAARLAELGYTLKAVVNTHGHFDHVSGNKAMLDLVEAPLLIHQADGPLLNVADQAGEMFMVKADNSPPPTRFLEDGEELKVGSLTFKVVHTPGHSLGSVTLIGEGKAFCGDLVFYGSVGRTDLPGGSESVLRESIKTHIKTLPDDTVIYPGHGPETTVGQEKRHNPFF